jgi:hypothetical protein
MQTYGQTVQPPALFIDIIVRHPEDSAQIAHISAKIDTAADISAIPTSVIAQLGLPITKKLRVKGYDDVPITVFTYSALLEVDQAHFDSLRVIATAKAYALLGRDVLNHFYLHLDGPELTFDLSLTPI